ncbi:MAG: transglycosylase domain-containing protein, partial [Deltaproteobacteria bacterium]|nr:transglycosylase domain-containing protein [Deltaproteobacteria bacterium]
MQKISIKRGKGEFHLLSGASEKKYIAEGLEFNLEREGGNFGLSAGGFVISGRGIEGGFAFSGKVNGGFIPFEGRFSTEGRLLALAARHFIKNILVFDDSAYRLHVDFSGEPDAPAFKGDLEFRNAGLFFTKLCLPPLEGLSGEMRFSGELGREGGVFQFDLEEFRLKDALFTAGVVVRETGRKPVLDVVFSVPKQSCQSLIESIPPVMIPRLEGIELDGTIDLNFNLHLNFKEIQKTNFEIEGNFDECRAVSLGRMIDVEKLNRKFVHSIYTDEKTDRIKVGPATGDFIPLGEIPEPVWQAALATEDMGFFKHKGFKLGLIKRAIKLDLEKGWFVYGGSTISQQLVKNLFLSREKTIARKLEEAIITWEMERSVEKERILELYLNCIEFGTKVFGIKKAAQVYFNKLPSELTPLEAAFIMAAKPDPRYAP